MAMLCFMLMLWVCSCLSQTNSSLCDVGDLETVCTITQPKSLDQFSTITGNALVVEAAITSNQLIINMTSSVLISSLITSTSIEIITPTLWISTTASITLALAVDNTVGIQASQVYINGSIKGNTYITAAETVVISGSISADGYGYPSGMGPGQGVNGYSGSPGGGASYGGWGTFACNLKNNSGSPYGNDINPTSPGSGGGNAEAGLVLGGSGGGAIIIQSSGNVTITSTGLISANGGTGGSASSLDHPSGAGGGSGGTIAIDCYSLTLAGTLRTNGGNGGKYLQSGYGGGAGSGGRLFVNATSPNPAIPGAAVTSYGGYRPCGTNEQADDGEIKSICPPGTGTSYSFPIACALCPAAYYSVDGHCYACPEGTFSNVTGATSNDTCTPCPAGTYNLDKAATQCTECYAGTYSSESGAWMCEDCPAGTTSEFAATSCTPCPPGRFAEYPSSQLCFDCSSGTFSNTSGSAYCSTCPGGTFAAGIGSVECTPCPFYQYSEPGWWRCEYCPAGMIPAPNQASCAPATSVSTGSTTKNSTHTSSSGYTAGWSASGYTDGWSVSASGWTAQYSLTTGGSQDGGHGLGYEIIIVIVVVLAVAVGIAMRIACWVACGRRGYIVIN